jgi:2-iminoacetate synthase
MKYTPQDYKIKDERMKPFIDDGEIWENIHNQKSNKSKVRDIISKSLNKNRLSIAETATLINTTDREIVEEIKIAAKQLKELIYGNRIVLFAPLYVGNYCTNDCSYCGFRTSNKKQVRSTLSKDELIKEVEILEDTGQKRLILVFGEHPQYDAQFIHNAVKTVYEVKKGSGEIRRVNINAAPFEISGFQKVKEAGIGTYQIFQETYHEETYKKVHPSGPKNDFNWRLTALDRAQEAGIDDVGIGALFGVFNWRYEVLGLIRHVNHFESVYHVGPHTISFPRVQNASDIKLSNKYQVNDSDFTKLVAILRLAVPYTGLILTAREPAHIRDEILQFGVSQIDGGTNIEIKGYSESNNKQNLNKEQFQINDNRSLNEIINELINKGYIPSFCTSCYRTGRTGEHFMEFSVPGFIKNYCQPNALLTLAEYLEDYAPADTKETGYKLINKELEKFVNNGFQEKIEEKLKLIKEGKRDLYF